MRRKHPPIEDFDDFMDDTFAFIAGYTAGGFPYGTTWEALGIDPALPLEEKQRLYDEKEQACNERTDINLPSQARIEADDTGLPFQAVILNLV